MLNSEKGQFLSVLTTRRHAYQHAMAQCGLPGTSSEVDALEDRDSRQWFEEMLERPEMTKYVIDASSLGATIYDGEDMAEFLARYTVAVLVIASRKELITVE